MYTAVSIMNMNAWMTMISVSKIAQPTLSSPPKKAPTTPVAAHRPRRRKMISPAYILPYRRSEWDRVLETYSTTLKTRLKIHSTGLEPNGEQNSSWIQPPRPFTLIAKKIDIANTVSESANVVFTSAVATPRNSG